MSNNLTEKRKLGNLGEDLASRFLIKHGFIILDRNYLRKCGELDIIASKDNLLHFIEVKSISCEIKKDVSDETTNTNYRPEDNVHAWKLGRISKTIQVYLIDKNVSDETNWQFDVVTVYIDKDNIVSRVKMLENVVL